MSMCSNVFKFGEQIFSKTNLQCFSYLFSLTNFIGRSPYEKSDSLSADKQILCLSRVLKASYNFYVSPPSGHSTEPDECVQRPGVPH